MQDFFFFVFLFQVFLPILLIDGLFFCLFIRSCLHKRTIDLFAYVLKVISLYCLIHSLLTRRHHRRRLILQFTGDQRTRVANKHNKSPNSKINISGRNFTVLKYKTKSPLLCSPSQSCAEWHLATYKQIKEADSHKSKNNTQVNALLILIITIVIW